MADLKIGEPIPLHPASTGDSVQKTITDPNANMRKIIQTQSDGSKNTNNTRLNDINQNKTESNFQLILSQIFSFFKEQFANQNKQNHLFSENLIQKLTKLETQLNNSKTKLEFPTAEITKNNREFIQEFVKSFNPEYLTKLNSTINALNEKLTQFIEKQSSIKIETPTPVIQAITLNNENFLNLKDEISQLNNNIISYGNAIKDIFNQNQLNILNSLNNLNNFDIKLNEITNILNQYEIINTFLNDYKSQLININNNLTELKVQPNNIFSNLENILNNFETKFAEVQNTQTIQVSQPDNKFELILNDIKTRIKYSNWYFNTVKSKFRYTTK